MVDFYFSEKENILLYTTIQNNAVFVTQLNLSNFESKSSQLVTNGGAVEAVVISSDYYFILFENNEYSIINHTNRSNNVNSETGQGKIDSKVKNIQSIKVKNELTIQADAIYSLNLQSNKLTNVEVQGEALIQTTINNDVSDIYIGSKLEQNVFEVYKIVGEKSDLVTKVQFKEEINPKALFSSLDGTRFAVITGDSKSFVITNNVRRLKLI